MEPNAYLAQVYDEYLAAAAERERAYEAMVAAEKVYQQCQEVEAARLKEYHRVKGRIERKSGKQKRGQ